jgi:hypothetical protein
VNHPLEQLARQRIDQHVRRTDRRGLRRSARLIALDIRASRRHAD